MFVSADPGDKFRSELRPGPGCDLKMTQQKRTMGTYCKIGQGENNSGGWEPLDPLVRDPERERERERQKDVKR